MPQIYLFDLDGVLIQPGGYRAAYFATMRYYLKKMGLEQLLPGHEVPELFEANLITAEWDMIPVCLAVIFEQVLTLNPGLELSPNLDTACEQIRQSEITDLEVDFTAAIQGLIPILRSGGIPSEAVLTHYRAEHRDGFLHSISKQDLFNRLFGHTRAIDKNPVSRTFQNYLLGHMTFSQSYRCKPEFECLPVLQSEDRPAIRADLAGRLTEAHLRGELRMALYTARPSLPPREIQDNQFGYTPEAELATQIIQMKDMPLIGYGRLEYIGRKYSLGGDDLLKPAPFQALAAVAAAWSGDEWGALVWAARHSTQMNGKEAKGLVGADVTLPGDIELHIFEDSPIGIIAAQKAIPELARAGIQARLHSWGIAESLAKQAALRAHGAVVFSNVNEAVEQVWLSKTSPSF